MIAQRRLGGLDPTEQRHSPRPRTRPRMRISHVRSQQLSLVNSRPRAACFLPGRSSLLGRCSLFLLVAPHGIHKLTIVAKTDVVARDIVPEKSGGRVVNVRLIMFERIFVGHLPLRIVSPLFAAIS